MSKLNKSLKLKISKDISWQNYFGVTYIIKESTGKIYTFEGLGAEIWNYMQIQTEINLLCEHFKSKYINDKEIEEVCFDFIDQLKQFNLIVLE